MDDFEQEKEHPGKEGLGIKKKRMMIYFIEAAKRLLREEGAEGLTVRRIAGETGYNSATLYHYFEDLEHLEAFGSVCYLREYVLLVSQRLKPEMTALEQYQMIYRCFNQCAFASPEIFYHMFFGRNSSRMASVLQIYYQELFPSELDGLTDEMRDMLTEGSLSDRDRVIMKRLVREGFVAQDKVEQTLAIIVALHQSYIYQACIQGERLDVKQHAEQFNRIFDYVMELAGEENERGSGCQEGALTNRAGKGEKTDGRKGYV